MSFDIETITKRLESLGYEVMDSDEWVLIFCMEVVKNDISNQCNMSTIPEGLVPSAIDMVCGRFLFEMRQSGRLYLGDLDLDGAITSIKQGDTSVTFDTSNSSDESKFNALVSYLTDRKDDLLCYRRMYW